MSNKEYGGISHGNHSQYVYTHDVFRVFSYAHELNRLGLWNMQAASMKISDLYDKMNGYLDHESTQNFGYAIFGRKDCRACAFNGRFELGRLLESLKLMKGLCLDCIINSKDKGDDECRIKH